jgi:hypothetical protein
LFDKALPNHENKLRTLISDLKQHGQILLVVDQPATIGALPVAVARSEGVLVGWRHSKIFLPSQLFQRLYIFLLITDPFMALINPVSIPCFDLIIERR